MTTGDVVFIGIRGQVLALDRATGTEIWRAHLKGSDFVNVALLEGELYAATKGELFALDPASGQLRWHNRLKGLGTGLLSIAGPSGSQVVLHHEKRRQDQARAAAAAAAASG